GRIDRPFIHASRDAAFDFIAAAAVLYVARLGPARAAFDRVSEVVIERADAGAANGRLVRQARKRTRSASPRLAVHERLRIHAADFLAQLLHRFEINESHQIETESV